MKPIAICLLFVTNFSSACCVSARGQDVSAAAIPSAAIEVHFTPQGDIGEAVIKEINAAKSSILVQAYSFDYRPIAKALISAKQRNVEVTVLLDKDKTLEEKAVAVQLLLNAGVPTRLDGEHGTAHNKTMIIDGQIVITGSFNFTRKSAKENAENLLVIRDKTLAGKYTANWSIHAAHSKDFDKPAATK